MAIRPKIKSFGYATILYGFSNLLTKIVAVTLIPLYTNYLTVYEVGIIVLLEMIELFVVTLIPIGCVNAMWRYLPEAKGLEKNRIIISTFATITISGILIIGLLFLSKDYLNTVLNLSSNDSLISFVLFSCFLKSVSSFIYWLLQYKNRAFFYLIISVVQFIALILLTIYFIVGCQSGVIGIYYAKAIVFSILFIFTIITLIRKTPVIPSLRIINKLLSYGLPIIPLILLMPVLNVSDRYFLKIFVSVEEIGLYGIAYKFGMLINMFLVIPIQRSWGPQMFQVGNSAEESRNIHQDITFYYSFIGLFILLGLSFFSDAIISVFANENYLLVSWLIPWISLAYFIGGFKIFFLASASLADRTDLFVKIGFYTILVNIISNYFLIRDFGVEGAVASTILSYIILILLLLASSKNINQFNWPIKRIWHGALIALLLIIVFQNIEHLIKDYEIIIKCIFLFMFPIISIITKLIGRKEINGLRFIWESIFRKIA